MSGICPYCGKRGYASRRAAKDANATARWRLRLYECPYKPGTWHVANGEKA